MRRLAATLVVLLLAVPALARERGPVCRQPSVLDEISRQVRARDYYGNVDPRLVSEEPTADPAFVRCRVCVLSSPYDTARFGGHPVGQCVARNFEVHIVPGGFVVRYPR